MNPTPLLVALALVGATQQAPAAPGHDVGADPWRFKALTYYRADAFRELVAAAMCRGSAVERQFELLSARLEGARAKLAELSQSPMFTPRKDEAVGPQQCSEKARIALKGFEDKVIELEAAAEEGVP